MDYQSEKSDEVRSTFETHAKMAKFKSTPSEDIAISTRIFTRKSLLLVAQPCFLAGNSFSASL